MVGESALLREFRVVGRVCGPLPSYVQRLGNANFLTVSLGKSWQIYDCEKLTLKIIGKSAAQELTSVVSKKELVFTAVGRVVEVWHRARKIGVLEGHVGVVYVLLIFGEMLLSIGEDQRLLVWNLRTLFHTSTPQLAGGLEPVADIQLPPHDRATTLIHPVTYLNKVLIGYESGRLEIWNTKSQKKVYTIAGWGSAVRALEQSPALDVVGVGLEDGRIIVHNIKVDEPVVRFKHEGGAVRSLAFRSDGEPFLCSVGTGGTLAVWNLQTRRLQAIDRNAHDGAIAFAHFMLEEPLLLTTGADNAIKTWIFDSQDGTPRLLRSRSGHYEPPTTVRFHDKLSIITAGSDQALRMFMLHRDQMSFEFSQGHIARRAKQQNVSERVLKIHPVTQLSSTLSTQRHWDNVISCHEGDTTAYAWSVGNKRLGEHRLRPKEDPSDVATAVCVTQCGNFGFVGRQSGRVEKYNMQSGIHRGIFQGHGGPVRALVCNNQSNILMSCGDSGQVRFWWIKTGKSAGIVQLEGKSTAMAYSPESNLIAVATEDNSVHVLDLRSRPRGRVVRRFTEATSPTTDLCFSPDGRWLVTSCKSDGSVRVYDLPTARLIDWMRFSNAVTSVSFSPEGDFVATTHEDRLGVYLWANKAHFSTVFPSVPKRPIAMDEADDVSSDEDSDEEVANTEDAVRVLHFSRDDVTRSEAPDSTWMNLANWDAIQERNKPAEPAAKPPDAPFFLPTVGTDQGGSNFEFDTTQYEQDLANQVGQKRKRTSIAMPEVSQCQLVRGIVSSGCDVDKVSKFLLSLSPANADSEIRSIALDLSTEERELQAVMDFFLKKLRTNREFEFFQAYLRLFLKVHNDTIRNYPALLTLVVEIKQELATRWIRLEDRFDSILSLTSYFSRNI